MAAGVRRERLDLGPLRRRDLSRAGVLLLGVQALGRAADRGRLVLPVDHPAGLGLRLLDRAGRRRAYPAHLRHHDSPPIVAGTVMRVDVEHLPKPNASPLKTLWLWWSGPGEPDLDLCWRAYLRRFDIEHTFRFVKSTLGW